MRIESYFYLVTLLWFRWPRIGAIFLRDGVYVERKFYAKHMLPAWYLRSETMNFLIVVSETFYLNGLHLNSTAVWSHSCTQTAVYHTSTPPGVGLRKKELSIGNDTSRVDIG